ncbi:MAG: hypothetical protein KJO21_13700 [Verrucomicrobiae bacterium]|nr:hypothetical protein [Verrucomicrobiae bacterium]NNJ44373.1 hypothetical protein [Akkermansiaceae bacterium]
MRGIPPLQAIILLIALGIVGYAGSQYIDMGNPIIPPVQPQQSAAEDHIVEAEIELIFSSPPHSYTLIQPSTTGEKDRVILQSSPPIDNPTYGNAELVVHRLSPYWLDIRWPEEAEPNSHHFVQIYISPSHGESQRYSFFTSSVEMNETFEYSTGENSHE